MDGALFFEEVTSVPAVYSVLDGASERMSRHLLADLAVLDTVIIPSTFIETTYIYQLYMMLYGLS
ncbi:hypothetical protein C6P52_00150 [Enterococcus mundtii]|nr:hypothetical protein C6P52_00150 [Enterococcus mundtii]PTO45133.1 hypothetical protein C6P54_01220 [Enterococcus mundtii]